MTHDFMRTVELQLWVDEVDLEFVVQIPSNSTLHGKLKASEDRAFLQEIFVLIPSKYTCGGGWKTILLNMGTKIPQVHQ